MKSLIKEIEIYNTGIVQCPILPNGLGWNSTELENLNVVESGDRKVLLTKIIRMIDSAESMICIQSFLIQDSAIIDTLIKCVDQRGIKVFVLSSAEVRIKESIEEEEDFIKSNYIQLLDKKFKNHFVHRSADNFHGKYILVDPRTKPKGFVCTNNFTENGFTKNPELAVELNTEQCRDLFKIFVYHFWEHSKDEQTATNEFEKVKPARKFNLPKIDHILLTSPDQRSNSLNKTLLDAIKKAKKTISLSTFQLDKGIDLVKAIADKAKQNVAVTLFCRPNEKMFNDHLKELIEAGVEIYFHPNLHAKSMLIDRTAGFVFTANLVSNGLEKGLEVGIKLNEEQTKDLGIIHQKWKNTFPSKTARAANITDLQEIYIFQDGKITKKKLGTDAKIEKTKVIHVADLFSLFNKNYQINDRYIKSIKVHLTGEIEFLPNGYKTSGTDIFEVIDAKDKNGKKIRFVVVKSNFSVDDMDKLKELKELKIYADNS